MIHRKVIHMNDRIVIDPQIQHGKPVIRGTRVPITRITGGLADGMSFKEIQDAYEVTEEDIRAVLSFVSELVESEDIRFLPERKQ